eukprot:9484214-Pyramimonas_sp.AAC.3
MNPVALIQIEGVGRSVLPQKLNVNGGVGSSVEMVPRDDVNQVRPASGLTEGADMIVNNGLNWRLYPIAIVSVRNTCVHAGVATDSLKFKIRFAEGTTNHMTWSSHCFAL